MIQRDLIEKQLTQKPNRSNEGFFVSERTNDSSSSGGGKNKNKSKISNKGKTYNYCKLKKHIKKDC